MKTALKIILAAGLIHAFGNNLIGPYYAIYVQQIGGSIMDMGYTHATYLMVMGILIFVFGYVSDRYSKELMATLGYALSVAGTVGYMVIDSAWQLFGVQIIFALSGALLIAPYNALISKYVNEKDAGMLWGLEGGSQYLLAGLSVIAGAWIVDRTGFLALFACMVIMELAATFVQLKLYLSHKKMNKVTNNT